MSTNYYTIKHCDHCHHEERLHVGKSANGWCFSLATHPSHGIASLDDWRRKFGEDGITIEDEYGHPVTPAEMLATITERSGSGLHRSGVTGQCEPGPNGLRRCTIDGRHCIGHGDGTWDLWAGDFH